MAKTEIKKFFLGFYIPQNGKARNYFKGVKDATSQTVAWIEFLESFTSLVTDSENRNT